MHQIECPWCGLRDDSEFSYQGDSNCRRETDAEKSESISDLVYFRDNPKGWHDEYWHHVAGCRQYIRVRRHTLTHEIETIMLARPPADKERV